MCISDICLRWTSVVLGSIKNLSGLAELFKVQCGMQNARGCPQGHHCSRWGVQAGSLHLTKMSPWCPLVPGMPNPVPYCPLLSRASLDHQPQAEVGFLGHLDLQAAARVPANDGPVLCKGILKVTPLLKYHLNDSFEHGHQIMYKPNAPRVCGRSIVQAGTRFL